MKRFLAFATLLFAALPLAAQPAADQGGLTRQQGDEILKELRQIRQLLERQQAKPAAQPQEEAPTKAKITDLSKVSMLGSKEAPLTIVEYTDYQCPFCQRFHVTAFHELKKAYIDTGKVRFYSKDMPLDFHPNAMRAAHGRTLRRRTGQVLGTARHHGRQPELARYRAHHEFRRGSEIGHLRPARLHRRREV